MEDWRSYMLADTFLKYNILKWQIKTFVSIGLDFYEAITTNQVLKELHNHDEI